MKIPFSYTVVRSNKRKTIALHIKNAEVTIRAPQQVSQDYLDKLLKEKTPWIMRKLADSRLKISTPPPIYLPENTLLIDGSPRRINVFYHKKSCVTLTNNTIDITLPSRLKDQSSNHELLEKHIRKQLSVWMKERMINYLDTTLSEVSETLNLIPTSYKVRLYKARWGSCNNKRELSFNYLLAMAPAWVVDYVIVHELCHIKHLNHSSHFWQLVSKHMPNYQEASLWLKKNQHQMIW